MAQIKDTLVTGDLRVTGKYYGNIGSTDITDNVTIASGDRIVINDESAGKIANSSITFGTATSTFLANNGTWQVVGTTIRRWGS